MRRRGGEQTLSLFAFQDIITGVAGVMLFILMLLVVQLALPAARQIEAAIAAAPPARPRASADDVQRVERLRQELSETQTRIDTLFQIQSLDPVKSLRDRQTSLNQANARRDELNRQIAELENRLRGSPASDQRRRREAETMVAMQDEMASMRALIEDTTTGQTISFHAANERGLWMIDVRATRTRLMLVERPGEGVTLDHAADIDIDELARRITDRLRQLGAGPKLVVLLRPSAADLTTGLLDALRSSGYITALELLDERTRLIAGENSRG